MFVSIILCTFANFYMSEILLNKSEQNKDAAQLLHDEHLYCSSVHCSYYSCYQLMIHIIYNVLGHDEERYSESDEIKNANSHNYTMNIIRQEIIKTNSNSIRNFNDYIKFLKNHRKKADYQQINILKAESILVIQKAENFKTILKNSFSL
jgi:uncharacterized protein (UPF0332 family)